MAGKSQKKVYEAETIKQRILLLADVINVTRRHLTEEVMGMTMSSFGGDAAKTPINSRALRRLVETYPSVSLMWLVMGEGEMVIKAPFIGDEFPMWREGTAIPQWLVEERRIHSETVLSQQRTIERLAASLGKEEEIEAIHK